MSALRITARTRLTLTYLGLFVLLGAGLLALNYQLLAAQLGTGSGSGGQVSVNAGAGVTTSSASLDPRALDIIKNYRTDALHSLLRVSVISLAAATVLAGLLVWLVARRALRPLQAMSVASARITERNLDERLSLAGPRDELRDLAETFNAMMDRLAAGFAHERRLVANASHELGTPIANQRTVLEVALDDPNASADQLRDACQTALDQAVRTQHLLHGMLTIAQAEHAQVQLTEVRLDHTVRAAIQTLTKAGITVESDLPECLISADEFLLDRMISNLAANAQAHNITDGWVRAEIQVSNEAIELRIENSADPIDPTLAESLTEPFRRGTTDRTSSSDGSGLGLAISTAIAQAHGWELVVEPGPASFRTIIRFPNN